MAEGGILPPIVLELRAKATELRTELGETKKELSELEHHTAGATKGMSGSFTKAAGYGKTLTVGLAGAAVAVGGFAIECATSAQVVDAKLSTAVKNAGGNMEELDPKIAAVDSRLRTFGFTNDQTNTALATLTVATRDPQKALDDMGVAADLARAKNISLNDASLMVAKAMEGQTRPLKALGIDLPVYAGNAQAVKLAQLALTNAQQKVNDILTKTPGAVNPASKAHASYEKALRAVDLAHQKLADTQSSGKQIMAALEQRVHGMAAAYGDTLKGKIEAGKASVEAMGETLGKKLIPVVVGALGAAQKFVGWLGQHTPVLYTVAGIIGTVVVGAILAYIGSLVAAGVRSTIEFAKMIAKAVAWAASTAASVGETVALWGMYAAQGIGRAVVAAATGFASMVAAGAAWVAQAAVQTAQAIASGAVWIAEHVAMAAVAVVQYGAIAVAATAAFVAENAATLGIIAVIAVLVAAIVYAATHWKQVWGAISAAAQWAYDSVLKPVGNAIVNYVIHPIVAAVQWYLGIWVGAWHLIGAGASAVYNSVILPLAGGIRGVFNGVVSALSWLSGVWSSLWNGIGNALRSIYNSTIGPIVNTIKGAIGGVQSAVSGIGSVAGSVGHFLGFANGGWIPGAPGAPIITKHHGGEYTLSRDMLAGRQAIDPQVVAAVAKQPESNPGPSATQMALTGTAPAPTSSSSGNGGAPVVNVYAQTNASASRIGAELGWVLRKTA